MYCNVPRIENRVKNQNKTCMRALSTFGKRSIHAEFKAKSGGHAILSRLRKVNDNCDEICKVILPPETSLLLTPRYLVISDITNRMKFS